MADQTPDQALDGTFLTLPPRFFSLAFHVSFLPRVIAFRIAQYRHRDRNAREHAHIEIPLIIFGGGLLIALGASSAIKDHSIFGIASTLLGVGGIIGLMIWAVYSEYRNRKQQTYRYDYVVFMPSIFFFFVLLGGSAGLIGDIIVNNTSAFWHLWAAPGLVVGYVVGVFVARWVHALGFMTAWVIYLAILGIFFLPFEDLLMLWIFASKNPI